MPFFFPQVGEKEWVQLKAVSNYTYLVTRTARQIREKKRRGDGMEYVEKIMTLIANSGEARSKAMEAIQVAKTNDFIAAKKMLQEASDVLRMAHKIQTGLIQEEAGGSKQEITILMIHAQDHLMNAMTVKDLAAEFIELYEVNKK